MCMKHTMTEASDSMPVYYNSLYTHGVDGKRRVQVPAKWRPESPDVESVSYTHLTLPTIYSV